jgi:hypothetical protein
MQHRFVLCAVVTALCVGAPLRAQDSKPAAGGRAVDVETLIERLEDESYDVRVRATEDLRALGEQARAALEARRDAKGLETRTRVRELLAELDEKRARTDGRPGRLRPSAPESGEAPSPFGGAPLPPMPPMRPFDSLRDLHQQMEEMRRWSAEMDRLMRGSAPRPGVDGPFGPGETFTFGLGPGGSSSSQRSMSRNGETLSVTEDEQGVKVKVVDRNGESRFEAKSLDELKAAHPELVERFGDTGMLEGGTVRVFRGGDPFGGGGLGGPPGAASRPAGRRRLEPAAPGAPERARKMAPVEADPNAPPTPPAPPAGVRTTRMLGVYAGEVPALLDKHLKLGGVGVVVDRVEAGGLAARAGVLQDDVLTHVAGEPVRSIADLRRLVAAQSGTFVVRVVREGAPQEITVDAPNPR